jgi:hypothetical protein
MPGIINAERGRKWRAARRAKREPLIAQRPLVPKRRRNFGTSYPETISGKLA